MRVQVKAVIVDSVAFVFRFQSAPAAKRVCMIHTMMSSLRRLTALGVAVVIINQVTGFTGSSSDEFAPALGTSPAGKVQVGLNRTAHSWSGVYCRGHASHQAP